MQIKPSIFHFCPTSSCCCFPEMEQNIQSISAVCFRLSSKFPHPNSSIVCTYRWYPWVFQEEICTLLLLRFLIPLSLHIVIRFRIRIWIHCSIHCLDYFLSLHHSSLLFDAKQTLWQNWISHCWVRRFWSHLVLRYDSVPLFISHRSSIFVFQNASIRTKRKIFETHTHLSFATMALSQQFVLFILLTKTHFTFSFLFISRFATFTHVFPSIYSFFLFFFARDQHCLYEYDGNSMKQWDSAEGGHP